jgi:putative ABC transport system substrate-binding protein
VQSKAINGKNGDFFDSIDPKRTSPGASGMSAWTATMSSSKPGIGMRRREFIAGLGAATALPFAASAQQPERLRRVGVLLGSTDDGTMRSRLVVFQRALHQLGWSEGRNLILDIRWGSRDAEHTKASAEELVRLNPDVIFAGPSNAVIPLLKATRSIPIIFVQVSDPLGQGVVDSLARPTGNVTGFSNLEFSLLGRWLQMLKEVAPSVTRVGVMLSTANAASAHWFRMFNTFAPSVGIEPIAAPVRERADIENSIEALAQKPNGGLIVPGDTLVLAPPMRRLIIEQTASRRLPAHYTSRAFVAEGGLMSYGIDQDDQYRGAASYVDRILRGEKPSDLPVQQPTKFEFILNLKTAKSLGLNVPLALQASADEVIE